MTLSQSDKLQSSLFLRACRNESISRPPVWLMRQAGRYLPEYRAIRAKVDFLTLCKTPELASQVTLQPIDILGVDAAVIFSDILVLLEAMGISIHFGKNHGPRIFEPIRTTEDVLRVHSPEIDKDLAYLSRAIELTAAALKDRFIPVLGFSGAPFTLACYAIEGETSRDFHKTKRFMYEHPQSFSALLEKLAEGITRHLEAQVEAGASAVQLFDTWGGILSEEDYRRFVLPPLQQIIESLKKKKSPVILYINGSTPHLQTMKESGADVLSVDWHLSLTQVRSRIGKSVVLQGNLDPAYLYSEPKQIVQATEKMLREHGPFGLIANLGHGLLPDIPVDHVKTFVETVKSFSY